MSIKPRPMQAGCLAALKAARDRNLKKALIVIASGGGKTLISAFDIKAFFESHTNMGRVLFVCHNNDLLAQSKKEFKSVFGDACSYGFFTGLEKHRHRVDFLFASFQTLDGKKTEFASDEFDYIVVDEAHHIMAPTFKATIEYFEPQFLLGMTATPQRTDGADLGEIFGEPPIFEFDFIDAMLGYNGGNPLLVKADYRLMTDEISGIEYFLDNDERVSLGELNRRVFIPQRDEKILAIIKEESAIVKDPRTIIFCASVEHAKMITEQIDDAVLVHGGMNPKLRQENLQAFRDGIATTIVARDVLNEGIDVPEANVIVFWRQTDSPIVFPQQFARGTRLHKDKEFVLVLDFVANCERLDSIFRLRDDVKKRIAENAGKPEDEITDEEVDKIFLATFADSKFNKRKIDIIRLIERARKYAYDKEILARALQRLGQKLHRTPNSADIEADRETPSLMAYYNHFGSVPAALIYAGFSVKTIDYTKDGLLSQLVEWTTEHGRPPTRQEVTKSSEFASIEMFLRELGPTYSDVMQELKATMPEDVKVEWDPDERKRAEVCTLFLEVARELKRVPTRADEKTHKRLPRGSKIRRLFGSRETFLKILEPQLLPIIKSGLIDLGRQKANELGRTPRIPEMDADSRMPDHHTINKYFVSFPNFLQEAGLTANKVGGPRKRKRQTEEEIATKKTWLITKLQTKAKQLGRTPTKREVEDDDDMPSPATYAKYFGSWNNALRAANLIPNVIK